MKTSANPESFSLRQIRFINGETDLPSHQKITQGTAVTDIALIPRNVSLCQGAWVISKQGWVVLPN